MTERITRKPFRKLVALDFDGVLHHYVSRWTDAATISDPPTPGAMEFLRKLVLDERFEVCIVSSRCKEPAGVEAISDWVFRHLTSHLQSIGEPLKLAIGTVAGDVGRLIVHGRDVRIVSERPPAHITLDDRGWRFDGVWPDLDAIADFAPWNKRPAPIENDAEIDDFDVRAAKGFDPADTMEIAEDEEDDAPVRTIAVIRTDLPAEWAKSAKRIVLDGVEHYLIEGVELRDADEEAIDGAALGVGDTPERMARYAAARGKTVDEVLADQDLVKAPDTRPPAPKVNPDATLLGGVSIRVDADWHVQAVRHKLLLQPESMTAAERHAVIDAFYSAAEEARRRLMPRTPAGHEEGDPEKLWERRLQRFALDNGGPSVLDTVRAQALEVERMLTQAGVVFQRSYRAYTGWRILGEHGWGALDGTLRLEDAKSMDFDGILAFLRQLKNDAAVKADAPAVERTLAGGRAG